VKVAVAVRVEVVLSHVKCFLIDLELNFGDEQVSTKVFVVAAAVKKAIQDEVLDTGHFDVSEQCRARDHSCVSG
jgi:hypothetical protein